MTPARFSRVFGAIFAFLILASALWSQEGTSTQSPAASQTKPETATTNVDEVSLDLVAHDKGKKLFRDLRPEDLQVMDEGTPVKLSKLQIVSGDANAIHLVTFVSERFSGTEGKNVQSLAARILKSFPSKGYTFSVLDVSGRLRLLQGFTEDRNTVREAIRLMSEMPKNYKAPVIELTASNTIYQKAIPESDDPAAAIAKDAEKNLISIVRTGADLQGTRMDAAQRARYRTLLDALNSARQIRQDRHSLPTLSGLLALVRSQQKLTGRKCIIYFTRNKQMDSTAKDTIRSITEAANQAGVILYVVDMNALDVGSQYQVDSALGAQGMSYNPAPQPVAGSGGFATSVPLQQAGPAGPTSTVGMAVDWLRQSGRNPFADTHSPLADMAWNTGGAYIDAQENVKKPLQQMVDDMTTYYVASYAPPIEAYDGSFRTIDIKPLRKGLTVKGKTGYYAVNPASDGSVRPFELPLQKMLADPTPANDIKFHAAALHFGELGGIDTTSVGIEIPVQQLETKTDQHTNLFSAHVSVLAQIKDTNGTVIEHFAEDIAHRAAIETMDRDKSATINVQRHFPATPGKYTLEIAVRDTMSEKGGVQRLTFEVPPPQEGPSISDVVLVRKVDGARAEDDPEEPMLFEKGRITPNISGDVPQGSKAVSLFFIVHPDAKSKDPVKVEMEASRNGRPGRRTPLPVRINDAQAAVPYLASFNSGLAPGDYSVKAIITQGDKASTKQIAFTVEGSQEASSTGGNAIVGLHSDAADDTVFTGPDTPKGSLAITPATNVVERPTPAELKQLIADAQGRALHYVESLPNFMCIQVTNRSYDPTGSGRWKLRDTITELLRYHEKAETRTMLEVNGKPQNTNRDAMKGTFSSGELGGVLRAVFSQKANATFDWQETDALGASTVQVFNYRVEQKNSEFSVVGMNNQQVMVAFHGEVYIDSSTRNVRRITLIADDMPKEFPTHYTSIAVDYDYVLINQHDYLMPISAQLRLKQGRREAVMNNIEFRNYRRFGSSMRILPGTPEAQQP